MDHVAFVKLSYTSNDLEKCFIFVSCSDDELVELL